MDGVFVGFVCDLCRMFVYDLCMVCICCVHAFDWDDWCMVFVGYAYDLSIRCCMICVWYCV